jgi:hypothetical protein
METRNFSSFAPWCKGYSGFDKALDSTSILYELNHGSLENYDLIMIVLTFGNWILSCEGFQYRYFKAWRQSRLVPSCLVPRAAKGKRTKLAYCMLKRLCKLRCSTAEVLEFRQVLLSFCSKTIWSADECETRPWVIISTIRLIKDETFTH